MVLFASLRIACPAILSTIVSNGIVSTIFCIGDCGATSRRADGHGDALVEESNSGVNDRSPFSERSPKKQNEWSQVATLCDRMLLLAYGLSVLIYHS